MPLSRRRVSEASALKALAHPVRIALLGALVTEGPMTASQAAALVDESPSNCSWHLRKLAEYGFVREAPGGTGRNRFWRAVSEGLEWGEGDDDDPTTRLAADALTDMLLEREMQRFRAARAARAREPQEWRDATGLSQSQLWLTAAEAQKLNDELQELFFRYTERSRDRALRPDEARLVTLVAWLVPSGPHRADPRTGRRGDSEEKHEAAGTGDGTSRTESAQSQAPHQSGAVDEEEIR
jgi:DNA-binding transcriptional ArsR family regulator